MKNAVDAIAYAELSLERLDMDVRGALLDGLRDDGVDQPDDGRLARHVSQVLQIFCLLGIGGELALALGGFPVIAVDRVENLLLVRQHGGDAKTGAVANGRDGFEVAWA